MGEHFLSLDHVHIRDAWLTIGSFDGVHLGHQAILENMVHGAQVARAIVVVVTFHPHPAVVLRGRSGDFYLTLPEERANLLQSLGVDVVITLPFDAQMAATSAREFMGLMVQHLSPKKLCVGHDFALGRGREGSVEVLQQLGQELGFTIQLWDPVKVENQVVSSSRIRSLLEAGDVHRTALLLGRPYRLVGSVVPGDQRGRTIGIPTANLKIPEGKLKPAEGVYACRAMIGEKDWMAAVNIGIRPTFDGQGKTVHVEAHLLDYAGDLYGQELALDFIDYLRGEQRFPSIQALIEQIHLDIEKTRSICTHQFLIDDKLSGEIL